MREVGVPGWAILAVLSDYQLRTHTQVMKSCELLLFEMGVNRSTLSRALHRLVALGFVLETEPPYSYNKPVMFQITDQGVTEVRKLVRVWKRLLVIAKG